MKYFDTQEPKHTIQSMPGFSGQYASARMEVGIKKAVSGVKKQL